MTFGGLETQFVLLFVAGVLLLVFLIIQMYRVVKLEKEVDQITLRYQQHLAASNPKQIDVFAASPFPCCIIDRHGTITSANTPFEMLVHPVRVKTVQEFDRTTLAALTKAVTAEHLHHDLITIKDTQTDKLRQFAVVSWPLRTPHVTVGRVVTLHEQTNVIRRKAHQADFENQLIRCIATLSNELNQSLQSKMYDTAKLGVLNRELNELSQYLLDLHAPLREIKPMGSADLVDVVKRAIEEVRPLAKAQHATFVTTLPRTSGAHVELQSFKLAFTTALTALIEYEKKLALRIHTDQVGKHLILSINVENLFFSEREVEQMFAFGGQATNGSQMRTLHLRASVVRELCSKHGVQFTIDSHRDTGTTFNFSLLQRKG